MTSQSGCWLPRWQIRCVDGQRRIRMRKPDSESETPANNGSRQDQERYRRAVWEVVGSGARELEEASKQQFQKCNGNLRSLQRNDARLYRRGQTLPTDSS